VTRAGNAQAAQTVQFATSDGTATLAGSDYTNTSGTLTFNQGDTTKTFTVQTANDAIFENDETFDVTLSNATGGATIGTAVATGTITNNDAAPSFAMATPASPKAGC